MGGGAASSFPGDNPTYQTSTSTFRAWRSPCGILRLTAAAGLSRGFEGDHVKEPGSVTTQGLAPLVAPFLALTIGLGAHANGFAATADEVRELARQATSDPHIQRDLPRAGLAERTARRTESPAGASNPVGPATYANDGADGRREHRKDTAPLPDLRTLLDSILQDARFALLGVLAIAGLIWAARRLHGPYRGANPDPGLGRRPDTNEEGSEPEGSGTEAEPEGLEPSRLDEADRLARDGAYGEAVGVILLHAIDQLRGTHHGNLPPSLTSREVRQRVRLDERGGEALGRLVAVAERSRFGGIPASESDFRACRERFVRHLATTGGDPPP